MPSGKDPSAHHANNRESIADVYSHLQIVARTKKRPFPEIARYYAMERFLYRMSVSKYKASFFLKGGLMLMVWNPTSHRATLDIDLLARTNNSIENFTNIFQTICSLEVPPDGVLFDTRQLTFTESQLDAEYRGLSVRFSAQLARMQIPMRLDIGFSDKILPHPVDVHYPVLLEFPRPILKGYTPETSIAEKLDAIVRLGLINTRMKDFYDIWIMLEQFQMKQEQLAPIIAEIFKHRETRVRNIPKAFTERFYSNPKTIELWNVFLKGIGHQPIPLKTVIARLDAFFTPILDKMK